MMHITKLDLKLVPISIVHLPSGTHDGLSFDEFELLSKTGADPLSNDFRAVSFDRLSYIYKNGVGVDPVDHVFWASSSDRAWEYGGWPKLIIALDHESPCRSYKRVPAETDPDRIAEIQSHYPTIVESIDGENLWFSRLP